MATWRVQVHLKGGKAMPYHDYDSEADANTARTKLVEAMGHPANIVPDLPWIAVRSNDISHVEVYDADLTGPAFA